MIPWDKIPKEYKYCAIDGGGYWEGKAWLYVSEPTPDPEGAWAAEGPLCGLNKFVNNSEVASYLATRPKYSLIYRYDYEESTTMYTERDHIKEELRKRLVKIKGIGPEKAAKGSDAVMEYLDSLVERQDSVGEKEYTVDRPEGVPKEYSYVTFKSSGTTEITNFWVTADRPGKPPSVEDTMEPGKFQGLFAYTTDVGSENRLEGQLLEILGKDPKTFYARFNDA